MILFLITGCNYQVAVTNPSAFYKTEIGLKWPAPPSKPRYELVKIINNIDDFTKNLKEETRTDKFFKWLLGEEKSPFMGFVKPYAVFAKNEKIYVVDQGILSVVVFDIRKGIVEFLQDTKDGDKLFFPTSVVVDEQERIYVTDPEKKRIVIYDKNGYPVDNKTLKETNWRPSGISYSEKKRRFYVVDTLNHNMRIFNKDFETVKVIGGRGEEKIEFNYPTHIFVDDEKEEVYVTDSMNFRIQFFDLNGKYLGSIGQMGKGDGNLERPKGVCSDRDGNIYVVDSLQDSIQVFDKEGKLLAVLGEEGIFPGQFNLPSGIFIDNKNYIYVTDSLNKRLQIIRYLGEGS
ncbi:MAG: 6-bladed beta-propeller [Proteobacteria bacterium]|nr:6-bladed beta-propeller [Pseudomonadota bacterium]